RFAFSSPGAHSGWHLSIRQPPAESRRADKVVSRQRDHRPSRAPRTRLRRTGGRPPRARRLRAVEAAHPSRPCGRSRPIHRRRNQARWFRATPCRGGSWPDARDRVRRHQARAAQRKHGLSAPEAYVRQRRSCRPPSPAHAACARAAFGRRPRSEFIFTLLKKKRIPIASLRCEFSASTLSEDEARLLQMPTVFPTFRVDYTGVDRRGATFILGETICRPDRFVFEIILPRRTR